MYQVTCRYGHKVFVCKNGFLDVCCFEPSPSWQMTLWATQSQYTDKGLSSPGSVFCSHYARWLRRDTARLSQARTIVHRPNTLADVHGTTAVVWHVKIDLWIINWELRCLWIRLCNDLCLPQKWSKIMLTVYMFFHFAYINNPYVTVMTHKRNPVILLVCLL